MWSQVYNPFKNAVLSTLAAAIPVVVILEALAFFHIKAHHLAGAVVAFAWRAHRCRQTLPMADWCHRPGRPTMKCDKRIPL